MIKNERQYRITATQIDSFREALDELTRKPAGHLHPLLAKAQREALESQVKELKAETREYEALQAGKWHVRLLESFDELPRALIRARIAKGLTQKQLAERLGLKEQQIQRYEASEYATASLERLKQVIRALGIKITEKVFLGEKHTSEKVVV
jgi:ribosome-binding protein aMBF1 (putative translation factor)